MTGTPAPYVVILAADLAAALTVPLSVSRPMSPNENCGSICIATTGSIAGWSDQWATCIGAAATLCTQLGKECLMNKMAPALPVFQRSFSVALASGPAAAAEARRHVREAIETWGLSADPYVAALLTSELVTNAIRHASAPVKLFVTCSCGQLRVYVHDGSRQWAVPMTAPAEAEDGRGLMLVASMATHWGCYRTSAGKAVYFTLAADTG
jgi:anti-sigma regulatory factor (Ser/Thr protein kinase)